MNKEIIKEQIKQIEELLNAIKVELDKVEIPPEKAV